MLFVLFVAVGAGAVGSAQGLVQMRSWVGVLGSRRVFPGGEGFGAVVASAQPGEVVRAGGAGGVGDDVVAVEVFGAGVAAGEPAGEVAGFDGVADVVGDAVFDGCHGGELAGDRVGDQPPPAGVGAGAQVAGDLRADRSEAFGFRGPVVVPDQRIGADHHIHSDVHGGVQVQEPDQGVGLALGGGAGVALVVGSAQSSAAASLVRLP